MGREFVAVGLTGKISRSYDGVNWTEIVVPGFAGENFSDICSGPAFGNPTWMATGSMAGVIWSRDAVEWTQRTDGRSPAVTLPVFGTCATDGAGTWVACSQSQTTPWRAIGDPATSFWDQQTTSLAHAVFNIRYGNLFVAITQFGELASSSDGGTWTNRTTGMNTSQDWLQDATYGGSLWVAMGGGGSGANEFKTLTSSNGTTWSLHTIASLVDHYGSAVAYGNGTYVVVGSDDFTNGFVATSSDGVTWTTNSQVFSAFDNFNDVAYTNGVWVATANDGSIWETTNPASTWTQRATGFYSVASVTSGEAVYFITADSVIIGGLTATFPADAVIVEPGFRFYADAVIFKGQSRSFAADAAITWFVSGSNESRNPHDRGEQHFGTMPATLVSYDLFGSVEQKLRYIWDRVALYESGGLKEASFTAAAAFRRVIAGAFTADAAIGSPSSLVTGSWTFDSVIKRIQSATFSANADIKRTQTGAAQANAVVRRIAAGTFTADAYLFSGVTGSFTGNAILKKTVTGSFSADAVIGSTGESGLLGDHILGTHRLGGE